MLAWFFIPRCDAEPQENFLRLKVIAERSFLSRPSLSVVVITKNEAHHIAACLQSVDFADQVVVLDSGSQDGTQEIASKMGAQVHVKADWAGFGVQKNHALALATSDWVLSLDADETVSTALREEILKTLENPQHNAYSLPRLSSYCGQYMRHSGWYPDRVTRLFKRQSAQFSNDLVHERLLTTGTVGKLQEPLRHETYENLETMLEKMNRYSSAGAQGYAEKGIQGSLAQAIAHGFWAFIRTYFLRCGFLDGRMGLVLAISTAEGTYYRYLKLWLLQKNTRPPF